MPANDNQPTTVEEIREWLHHAKDAGATHMLVVCDTFENEDYPVPVYAWDNVRDVYKAYNGPNMQRVLEVYKLTLDLEEQLATFRVLEF